jgi:hypothetical protein
MFLADNIGGRLRARSWDCRAATKNTGGPSGKVESDLFAYDLSKDELRVLKKATGFPRMTIDYIYVKIGSTEEEACEGLVKQGLMRKGPFLTDETVKYTVTREGRAYFD